MVCFRLSQQSMNSQSTWKNRFLPFFAHFQLKLPSVRIGFCRDAEIFRSTIPRCCLACRCLRTPCAAMWHGTADFWRAVSSSTPCMLHVPFQNLHTCSQLIFIFKTISDVYVFSYMCTIQCTIMYILDHSMIFIIGIHHKKKYMELSWVIGLPSQKKKTSIFRLDFPFQITQRWKQKADFRSCWTCWWRPAWIPGKRRAVAPWRTWRTRCVRRCDVRSFRRKNPGERWKILGNKLKTLENCGRLWKVEL